VVADAARRVAGALGLTRDRLAPDHEVAGGPRGDVRAGPGPRAACERPAGEADEQGREAEEGGREEDLEGDAEG
jgi:hypothetical protein